MGYVTRSLLLNQCERKLDNSSKKISEVLVEEEGLYSREDSERESLEDLFEPNLFRYSAVQLAHLLILIQINNKFIDLFLQIATNLNKLQVQDYYSQLFNYLLCIFTPKLKVPKFHRQALLKQIKHRSKMIAIRLTYHYSKVQSGLILCQNASAPESTLPSQSFAELIHLNDFSGLYFLNYELGNSVILPKQHNLYLTQKSVSPWLKSITQISPRQSSSITPAPTLIEFFQARPDLGAILPQVLGGQTQLSPVATLAFPLAGTVVASLAQISQPAARGLPFLGRIADGLSFFTRSLLRAGLCFSLTQNILVFSLQSNYIQIAKMSEIKYEISHNQQPPYLQTQIVCQPGILLQSICSI